jgi:predicted RNase H-like nuclease (RuvC/YqgF family)
MEALIERITATLTTGGVGIWGIFILMTGHYVREWNASRKLSMEDRQAKREGYAAQVAQLMAENRALAADQKALRDEYNLYRRHCQEETDELRRENRQESEALRTEIIRLRSIIEEYRARTSALTTMLAEYKPTDEMALVLARIEPRQISQDPTEKD